MKKIVLIDGHSILNRAFYGLPPLTNAKGFHTNAIYGFLNIFFKLMDEEKPDYVTVAFDVKAPTFRHEMYAAYKGTRKGMPEELREQVPVMQDVLRAMGVQIITQPGLEADDILGTLARRSEAAGMEVLLMSGDRDLLQIATDHITILLPKTKGGKTEVERYNTREVLDKYHVPPLGIIELKALMGDSADNIPGVPKVGEKTATDLLMQYGTVENLYTHLDEISKKGLHDTLEANRELAFLSKRLATIRVDAEVPYDEELARVHDYYTPEAYAYFRDLEFKNFLNRFETVQDTVTESADYVLLEHPEQLESSGWEDCENRLIGIGLLRDKDVIGVCISSETQNRILFSDLVGRQELIRILKRVIMTASMTAVFDAKRLYSILNEDVHDKISCTNIAAYLLNPLKNDYEPQDVANEYGGYRFAGYGEVFGKKTVAEVCKTEREAVCAYLCHCGMGNWLAYRELMDKLTEKGMLSLFREIEMPLSYVLYDMEHEGICVRREELKAYGEHLAVQIGELENRIYDTAGERFNINSPKQLGEILFEKMQLPAGKKTKTGYSTSVEVLEKLADEYPFVRDILEYRGLTKLKSTYADGLAEYIEADGRIHTNFNQTITATGRISSTEPNLQNIPMRTELGRQIRKVFVPRDGFVFVDADYSQIELRLMAHMSGDEELIEAYRQDADIHRITASKVFHIPFEEVTDLQRRNAKAVNFGIVYGISSFGLSQDLSISRKEAGEYINQYFATYPGVKRFLDQAVAEAKEKGYSTTIYGRIRPIPELRSANFMQRSFGERVAMNAPLQGSAADIMKIAMIRIHEELKKRKLRSRMLLQVHDEVLVETAEEELDEVYGIIRESMMKAADLRVELVTDIHSGANWYEAK
ncbi:MAG: DNA polymerase I [Lachnospiraceae bacterium]